MLKYRTTSARNPKKQSAIAILIKFLSENTENALIFKKKCKIVLVYRVKPCNKCIYAYFASEKNYNYKI